MMSIKNNILVIFSSIFLMLFNSALSQDIFLNINQNRTYNADAQKNVMFFVGQNESVSITANLNMLTFKKVIIVLIMVMILVMGIIIKPFHPIGILKLLIYHPQRVQI